MLRLRPQAAISSRRSSRYLRRGPFRRSIHLLHQLRVPHRRSIRQRVRDCRSTHQRRDRPGRRSMPTLHRCRPRRTRRVRVARFPPMRRPARHLRSMPGARTHRSRRSPRAPRVRPARRRPNAPAHRSIPGEWVGARSPRTPRLAAMRRFRSIPQAPHARSIPPAPRAEPRRLPQAWRTSTLSTNARAPRRSCRRAADRCRRSSRTFARTP